MTLLEALKKDCKSAGRNLLETNDFLEISKVLKNRYNIITDTKELGDIYDAGLIK